MLRLHTWQPRIGVTWDPWNDGATKVFAFAGRFSWAMPAAMTAAIFANNTALATFNLDPVSTVPDPRVIDHEDGEPVLVAGGAPHGIPVDSGIVAPYQDELTFGAERSLSSSLTVGLRGTYRRLGSAIETRCDFDRGSPETEHSRCAIITRAPTGSSPTETSRPATALDDDAGTSWPGGSRLAAGERVYRGIELLARKTVGDRLWIQASYVYSSLRGNYDGGINEGVSGASIPGSNEDFDYPALWHDGYGILALDRPHRFRLDGYWVLPWGLSVGLQAFAESGAPFNQLGYFNPNYGSLVFLVPRGTAGRLPTNWGADLDLAYPIAVGPVTVTLQAYLFNVFNKQIAVSRDEAWSDSPGTNLPATIYDPNQLKTNDLYGAVTGRSDPRSFRAALRVSF